VLGCEEIVSSRLWAKTLDFFGGPQHVGLLVRPRLSANNPTKDRWENTKRMKKTTSASPFLCEVVFFNL